MKDPLHTLEEILKRNGCDNVDLQENEVDRYFLFDKISDASDLDLAWSLFPEHREIRARAAEVDAVSDIVAGWGYRVPKQTQRCADSELIGFVRAHLAAARPFLTDDWDDIGEFIDNGYEIELLNKKAADMPEPLENDLFLGLYESLGDFRLEHFPFEEPLAKILYDWAIYLTKCDEVALYLLWPLLQDVQEFDPQTPAPAFRLWQYNCRTNYWIKDGDVESRVVCLQRPWVL